MADIESGKVKEVPVVGPYTYAKLSETNEESTAFERQAKLTEHEQKYQENMDRIAALATEHITPDIAAQISYILSLTPSEDDSEEEAAWKHHKLLTLKKKKDNESRALRKAERQARLQARKEGNN